MSRESKFDRIFKIQEYSYDHVLKRVLLVEEYIKRDLISVKRALLRFKKNSKQTRRQYKYYSKYIEPSILEILSNHEKGNWNFFWRKASLLTKINFFYALTIPAAIFIQIWGQFLEKRPEAYILALPALILAVLGITAYVLLLNFYCYSIITWFLGLFNYESGTLNRNLVAFGSATSSLKFYKRSAIILGVSGAMGIVWSKLGGFKGFGGGKFNGGGAGGSW